jgi:hypothetical protein
MPQLASQAMQARVLLHVGRAQRLRHLGQPGDRVLREHPASAGGVALRAAAGHAGRCSEGKGGGGNPPATG